MRRMLNNMLSFLSVLTVFPLFLGGCIGVYPINHKCRIGEFADFNVKEVVSGGITNLTVSGWRCVDSITGVKGVEVSANGGAVSIVAYTGPFWLRKDVRLNATVNLDNVQSVLFADTLIWTRNGGVVREFNKTIRSTTGQTLDELLSGLEVKTVDSE